MKALNTKQQASILWQ